MGAPTGITISLPGAESQVLICLPSLQTTEHSARVFICPQSQPLCCKEKIFLGCREEKADCTAGSLRFHHLDSFMKNFNSCSFPQSGCQRQGREKASGQAWRERRRGEAVLPLPQLRLDPLAPLSPSQTGSQKHSFSDPSPIFILL